MGRRRAERPRRRGRRAVVRLAALAALVTAAVVVPPLVAEPPRTRTGPPAAGKPQVSAPATLSPTDVSRLPIRREPFCSRIDDAALGTALGGQVAARTSYRPGDRVTLAEGLNDVAGEFGCGFAAGDAAARVWVFATPVSVAEGRRLVRDARGEDGCRYPGGALGFGRPGLTGVCRSQERVQVTMRGLFGDTWLTCQLRDSAPAGEVRNRAERWCLHVAATLGARP